jgi:hypothetical protein
MELGDRPAHVLGGFVSQQIQLRAIRPADDAVGAEAVKSDRGALDEIPKLLVAGAHVPSGD